MSIVTVHGNQLISLQPDTIYHGFSIRVLVGFLRQEPLGMAALRNSGPQPCWTVICMLLSHLLGTHYLTMYETLPLAFQFFDLNWTISMPIIRPWVH